MQKYTCHLLLAVLAAAFSNPSSAQGVPGVPNCDGAAMLVCAPVVAVVSAKNALRQASTENRLKAALEEGNAKKAKPLLKKAMRRKSDQEKAQYLHAAADAYLKDKEPAKQPARLEIAKYVMENIDLRGEHGSAFLQRVIATDHYSYDSRESFLLRRLALAEVALAQGANARNVNLSACRLCGADLALLPLLLKNGANIATSAYLLTDLVRLGDYDAAQRLIELGANANGAIDEWRGPLHHVAEGCVPREQRGDMAPPERERLWSLCVDLTTSFAKFAIAHGADPNGQSSVATLCDTPYSLALQGGNKVLAETLRKLGADPTLAQRCKREAPPGAVP